MSSKKKPDSKQTSISSFLTTKTKSLGNEVITDESVETFFNDKCAEVFEPTIDNNLKELCSNYKEKLKVNELQLKHAKSLLKESMQLIFEKDLKLKSLECKLSEVSLNDERQTFFKNFEKEIGSEDLDQLRKIKLGPQFDSTFVLSLMRILYRSNLSTLRTKSVTGRKFKGENRTPLTPKKKLIESMMTERIERENKNDAEKRIGKIGIHLKSAIWNINNSKYNTEPEKSPEETSSMPPNAPIMPQNPPVTPQHPPSMPPNSSNMPTNWYVQPINHGPGYNFYDQTAYQYHQ